MTIQDELIDHAFMACENRRSANQKDHARGAAVLANGGKLYTGCDVTINGDTNGMGCISGERAAILAAVADGQSSFDCLVIASDTMKSFPAPNGQSREFLRSFGVFPVVLVNCDMQVEETNTHALYPYTSADSSSHLDDHPDNLDDVVHEDVNEWTVDRVKRWLCDNNLSDMIGTCTRNNVKRRILLQLDDEFARDTLEIQQAVKRRQLVRLASRLKKEHMRSLKEKTLDELDEYVLVLETHRIKLVAKLKAIFDRFDSDNEGVLDGVRVEQALLYMDRPVDSVEVNSWINKLKDRRVKIDFTEFVAQYSALFSGHDPDVPVGETSRKDISHQREPTSPRRDDGTGWRDDDSLARPMSGGDERLVSSPRDKEDMKEGEVVTTRPGIAEQDLQM